MKPFKFFKTSSIERALADLKKKPAEHWEKKGQEMTLRLFRYTYETVSAYQQFLKEHDIDGSRIRTFKDFEQLPVMDKQSYLRKYDYIDLFPNRDITNATTISATSGSTGEPFYFPRSEEQDAQYEYIAELFLKNQFEMDKKSTLGIIGFGLGIWIGGIFTYKNFNKIAAKGYKLAILPIGPNKELYLKSLKRFGLFFDQVLLMGLPPFIKDLIDEAKDYGINWSDYEIRIFTATEGFSEEFRAYLAEHAELKNSQRYIINVYGTVELGTMAHETALTNLIRRIACQNETVFKTIFPYSNRVPTLAQYHPYLTYFEEVNGELIGSGFGSAIPLLRYRFPDRGAVVPFEVMLDQLRKVGVDVLKEARKAGIVETIMKLPFVYVYERSDFATTLLGITIYPEYIRMALQHSSLIQWVTGKFSMVTKNDRDQNQYLEVNVELRKNMEEQEDVRAAATERIVASLLERSTEYNYLYSGASARYRDQITPRVVLWPYNHHLHFNPVGKQRWTKR